MKLRNIILAVFSAVVPAVITSYFMSTQLRSAIAYVVSIVFSSLLLCGSYFLADILLGDLRKYRGQWIEEMRDLTNNRNLIGIGTIRYDFKTAQYTFSGKTYEKSGNGCREIFDWDIKYLMPIRDDKMEYICAVENPGESSIGSLKFHSKDSASGSITVMNGCKYKHNAYRITKEIVNETNAASGTRAQMASGRIFRRRDLIELSDYSKFALNYSNKNYPLD